MRIRYGHSGGQSECNWKYNVQDIGIYSAFPKACAQTQGGQRFTRVVNPANELLPLVELNLT